MQTTFAGRSPGRRSKGPAARLLAGALAFVLRLEERRRQRLRLSELDDNLLADIGLTPADARRECARPFWR